MCFCKKVIQAQVACSIVANQVNLSSCCWRFNWIRWVNRAHLHEITEQWKDAAAVWCGFLWLSQRWGVHNLTSVFLEVNQDLTYSFAILLLPPQGTYCTAWNLPSHLFSASAQERWITLVHQTHHQQFSRSCRPFHYTRAGANAGASATGYNLR